MKSKFVKGLCFLTVISILCSFAGCKKSSDDTSSWSMGDFTVIDGSGKGGTTQSTTDTKSGTGGSSGTASTGSSSGNGTVKGDVQSTPDKLKGTTLKIFLWGDLKNTVYGDAIKAWEKKTGVTVKTIIATKQSYTTELAGMIAADNSPDMTQCIYNNPDVVSNLQPIQNTGYDFSESVWDKELMRDFTFNGRTYAMHMKNSPQQNLCVIMYNKSALKKADMQDPYKLWQKNPSAWTWEKFWSMCGEFLQKNKNKQGYYGVCFSIQDAYVRCFNSGLYGYNPKTSKFENFISSSSSVKADTVNRYKTLVEMMNKKYADTKTDGTSFEMGTTLFRFAYSSYMENGKDTDTSKIGIVPVPTDSTSIPGYEYCGYGIPIGAKNAQAVPYFVRYVFSPDTYDLSNFYLDEQSKNVIEYEINKGNICYNNGCPWAAWNALLQSSPAQVSTVLDSYAPAIEDIVSSYNTRIPSFQK